MKTFEWDNTNENFSCEYIHNSSDVSTTHIVGWHMPQVKITHSQQNAEYGFAQIITDIPQKTNWSLMLPGQ